MRVALCTTTIHRPAALHLLRRYDSEVRFFIAGDVNSPDDEILESLGGIENAVYLSADAQKELGYACSELIGWRCIQRRGIAILEALKWEADVIVSWDTDNFPMDPHYFDYFTQPLGWGFDRFYSGLQLRSETRWHNQYGPQFKHRGFPIDVPSFAPIVETVVDAKVGVAAGLVMGDPDVDAYTRLARAPRIDSAGELTRVGYLVHPRTRCVFNSQNTAYLREFAPAAFCAPGVGRGDDIFASLLMQRVMRDRGYQVHIGPPFAFQQRNPHDLLVDLADEMFCMRNLLEVSSFIDKLPGSDSVIDFCRAYWRGCGVFSSQTRDAALAFLDDCERVMR